MNRVGTRVDMLNGPLFKKIIVYTIPIMLSGMLQLAYNAADTIVVGQFAENSKISLAAVGATGNLMNLFINICMGLSTGANVAVARYFGAGARKELSSAVHTAYALSLVSGVLIGILGFLFAPTLLKWTLCPDNVIDKSILYMRICFCGMIFQMVYNFAAGIIRASGETKKPFLILVMSGALNVVLNLVLVIFFKLDVAGVAIATVTANVLSAILVTVLLLKDETFQFDIRKIKIDKDKLKEIARIGIPSAIQSTSFTLSNTILQGAINNAGDYVMAACTAAASIENFVYISMNSFYHTALAFVGQNYAAKKNDRVIRVMFICVGVAVSIGIVLGWIVILFSKQLMQVYAPRPEDYDVVLEGTKRILIICGSYFTCGILDVLVGTLRGLGVSLFPMVSSIVGVCGVRLFWILTIFPMLNDTVWLYFIFPLSWVLTDTFHAITIFYIMRKRGFQNPFRKKKAIEEA